MSESIITDPYLLHRCKNPACDRPTAAEHCCAPCNDAHHYGHEIHAHSEGCDERDRLRRPTLYPSPLEDR